MSGPLGLVCFIAFYGGLGLFVVKSWFPEVDLMIWAPIGLGFEFAFTLC